MCRRLHKQAKERDDFVLLLLLVAWFTVLVSLAPVFMDSGSVSPSRVDSERSQLWLSESVRAPLRMKAPANTAVDVKRSELRSRAPDQTHASRMLWAGQ